VQARGLVGVLVVALVLEGESKGPGVAMGLLAVPMAVAVVVGETDVLGAVRKAVEVVVEEWWTVVALAALAAMLPVEVSGELEGTSEVPEGLVLATTGVVVVAVSLVEALAVLQEVSQVAEGLRVVVMGVVVVLVLVEGLATLQEVFGVAEGLMIVAKGVVAARVLEEFPEGL
jgi:hypothetical protein